jgi:transcriptional regulator with XRE-family HTH domain
MAALPRNEPFGEWVKRLRLERGFSSQRALARATGFSHTAIGDMEFGYVPKFGRLGEFAAAHRSFSPGDALKRRP